MKTKIFKHVYGLVEIIPDDLHKHGRHEVTREIGADNIDEAGKRASKLGWNYDYIIERS